MGVGSPIAITFVKSGYKVGPPDILIVSEEKTPEVRPLSRHSSVVRNLKPVKQVRLYVRAEDRERAEQRLSPQGEKR